MEEPTGIPGHVGGEGPSRRLQETLKALGISFEAEGEVTRIHLGEAIVEVKDDPEHGYITQIQVPLPVPGDDPSGALEAFRVLAVILSSLEGEVHYSVEEIVPGYPSLIGFVSYRDRTRQVEELLLALYRYLGEGGARP